MTTGLPRAFARWWMLLLLAMATAAHANASASGNVLFQATDPTGDDRGAGDLAYPRHETFSPHRGLMDLLSFRLLEADRDYVFEFQFAAMANPFAAPEGFYHPRVDLFIHTGSSQGSILPLRDALGVQFARRWPWQLWLRVAPFGGTALFAWTDPRDSAGRSQGTSVVTDSDAATVRVNVPKTMLPAYDRSWRFYVAVGSFDGLGSDDYRDVAPAPSEWLLHSAKSSIPVVDLLAPSWGPRSQWRQLAAAADGSVRTIYPVGGLDPYRIPWWAYAVIAVSAAGLAGHRWTLARWRRSTKV